MNQVHPLEAIGETVTRTLRTDILQGRYRAGDRLPSERDLAARFGTSRGVVREALKRLEQLGLADIQPGGARVRPLSDASLEVVGHLLDLDSNLDPGLLGQALRVVQLLMGEAVSAMVEHASDAELAHLQALIDETLAPETRLDRRIELRLALSRGFMAASHNLVLQLIANGLFGQINTRLLADPRAVNAVLGAAPDHARAVALRDAIGTRDRDRILTLMQRLMNTTHASTLRALAGTDGSESATTPESTEETHS